MSTPYDTVLESTDWVSVLLAAVICLAAYMYIRRTLKIPGPIGLPYLGYYPFLSDRGLHKQLMEMTKKYGDVFCFTVTGQVYAHLGSLKSMKEALVTNGNCFTRKPQNYSLLKDSVRDGLFYISGEQWKVLRRFFSQKMKDYGMGKKAQETWLSDSLHRTVNALNKSEGKDFDILKFFAENGSLSIRQLLFGSREVDDEDARQIIESFNVIIGSVVGTQLLLAGPLFKYVMMPFMSVTARYRKAKTTIDSCLSKIFREHEREFDKDNIRNLVDCYIDERRILEEKGDPRSKIYSERSFIETMLQIFGDGGTTIGALAATVLKAISERPEVQKKIQSEVDEAVGRDRLPSWDLKTRMPYTNAVIYEVIRRNEFFPLFPSLECTEETTVCGCPIPKGSVLLVNYYSAFMDPRIYEQPEKFDPSRFMPTADKKIKSELPSIFGMGKRSCLGESLASMETFLFVTTVMQSFDLLPPPRTSKQSTILGEMTVIIRAIPRKS